MVKLSSSQLKAMMNKKGFTLLELSIVLIIVGLLAGGVFVGTSLIRSAQLRGVLTQISQYQSAVTTFNEKYDALPGDISNATTIWGAANAAPATCKVTVTTGTLTCNGDGNGKLAYDTTGSHEVFRFWQQLASIGLIEGSYTGVAGSGGAYHGVINQNVPKSKMPNGGYGVEYADYMPSGGANDFPWMGHRFWFGAQVADNQTYGSILTPAEALELDSKFDDGKPGTGVIMTWKSGSLPNCTTTDVASTSQYKVADSGVQCSLFFVGDF